MNDGQFRNMRALFDAGDGGSFVGSLAREALCRLDAVPQPIDVALALSWYRHNVATDDQIAALTDPGDEVDFLRRAIESSDTITMLRPSVMREYVANAMAMYSDEAKKRTGNGVGMTQSRDSRELEQ